MSCAFRVALAALVVISLPSISAAQTAADTRAGIKSMFDIVKGHLTKTADQASDELYGFKPTADVRSLGQMLGHVANANYMICSLAAGEK
ncbi:MAG: DinB family protein, partial [Acidobacteriota bacterium]|nr:DinB family protein [Acidobacteriota bacterium]